jgi:hypothetical protein
MPNLDFYKDLYNEEIEQKESLRSSIGTPLSLISALAAVFYFYLTSFDFLGNHIVTGFFALGLLSSAFVMGVCIYHLIKSYNNFTGRTYRYPAQADQLRKHQKDLIAHYQTHHTMTVPQANEKFEEDLIGILVDAAKFNAKQNEERTECLNSANKFLIIAIVITIVNIIPFSINHFLQKKEIEKIEVVNLSSNQLRFEIDSIVKTKIKEYEHGQHQPTNSPDTATSSTAPTAITGPK